MRTPPWPALVFPLFALLAAPAEARTPHAPRVLLQRTVHWALGASPVELHVAPGAATLVRLEAFPKLVSLELTEGLPSLQLLPAGDASFVLVPSGDFTGGERALVTVRLGPPELVLTLLLVSREDAVDGEVRLVHLHAPTSAEPEVQVMARFLNATPQERLRLTVTGPTLKGLKVGVRVESILRLDSRVFLTLATWRMGRSRAAWKLERARLRVALEDGSEVEVPLLLVSSSRQGKQRRHTLAAPLPARFLRLSLSVKGEGAPEGFFPLPSGEEEPSP